MESIKNTLAFLEANWITILVCVGLLVSIYKKTKDYLSKSDQEKLEIAKKQISASILKLISDAEINWSDWNKAGSIKRSEVISKIYSEYPILSKMMDQEDFIAWLDEQINMSLKTLREIVAINTQEKSE